MSWIIEDIANIENEINLLLKKKDPTKKDLRRIDLLKGKTIDHFYNKKLAQKEILTYDSPSSILWESVVNLWETVWGIIALLFCIGGVALIFALLEAKYPSILVTLILAAVITISYLFYINNPENIARWEREENDRRILRESEIRRAAIEAENRKRENEERIREDKVRKENEREDYNQLSKKIRSMPSYITWRQRVKEEFGTACIICSSTEYIEIDHHPRSFHEIIKRNQITNIMEAYNCKELWDVHSGKPLCKSCHAKTATSIYFNRKNNLLKI